MIAQAGIQAKGDCVQMADQGFKLALLTKEGPVLGAGLIFLGFGAHVACGMWFSIVEFGPGMPWQPRCSTAWSAANRHDMSGYVTICLASENSP